MHRHPVNQVSAAEDVLGLDGSSQVVKSHRTPFWAEVAAPHDTLNQVASEEECRRPGRVEYDYYCVGPCLDYG